jgi:hypothetical protein
MEIVERLRRRSEEMEALSDPVQEKSTLAWQVYAQTLLAKAATDNVSAASEITRLTRERDEARAKAIEEAARYHDDLEAQHEAAHRWTESDHHMMMEREHRRHAAAIRKLGETGE